MKGLESFYNRDALIIVMKSDGFGTMLILGGARNDFYTLDYDEFNLLHFKGI